MLTLEGCRARQHRFLARLEAAGVPGAVITDPRDIHYLTGLFPQNTVYPYPSLLFLGPGLGTWLITGLSGGEALVDERIEYRVSDMGTMNPDNHGRVSELIRARAGMPQRLAALGYQRESLPRSLSAALDANASPSAWVEIDEILQDLQLKKDADELDCLRRAIRATLAGYTRAQQVIEPGVTELFVMTECQAAAQRYSREVHYFNGDFRCSEAGGFARARAIERGELYIIDAWSDLGGYWCDMSRAWVVGGEPTELQSSVYAHLAAVLNSVPDMARVGRSTQEFWVELDARIREHPHLVDRGLVHHGGHGIGTRCHEPPDLNRDRGGVFEVGNVFTCEPGAYSSELRHGVRVENVFHITSDGVEVLVEYPLSIVADPACPIPG